MQSPSKWYYVIATLALIWNLLGCMAFVADLMVSEEDIARLSEAEQAMYAARPVWAVIGTGMAVILGALGCIAMLLRQRWAVAAFYLSLIGLIAQDIHLFLLSDAVAIYGATVPVMQTLVLLIAIALILWSRKASSRGILR
ncbi:hypothetical protein [Alteromonas halophila]|uniref:Sugar transporter n=1 Tax=Alteromonas halophila TaxID=516698 RepID=A0A918MWS0_9ALTE|nr:hypothetical protein [Alteromonas halophila]GGW81653.1 hypothetical protein GCM10007391_13590 [Alteromonas halophila]